MKILDMSSDQELDDILILLTPSEANELGDKLRQLDPQKGDHLHVSDDNFTREITIAIYTIENRTFFNQRIQNLLND